MAEATGPRRPITRSLAERLEAAPGLYLTVFSAVYFIAQSCSNLRRPFWFDELITYYLAELPSIRQILPLIRQGIELNPPLPFWITWMVHHTLGKGEIITRLPAVTGFWFMCFCLFHFVRRRSDVVHGFLAFLLPLFTYTAWDATWARGYGLLLGFSASALLCWQLATDGVRRFWALTGLAASLAGAVSCHYYAVYVAGALGLGEIVRTFDRKRLDLPVWGAFAAGLTPMLAYLPLLRVASSASHSFWISPMTRFLYESYADLIGPTTMVLLLLMLLGLRLPVADHGRDWKPATLGRHEVAVCFVLVAMPLTVFLASFVSPVAFYSRYVQPVVIGFSVVMSMFVYRAGGGNPRFRNLTVSVVIWLCLLPWAGWHVAKLVLLPSAQSVALAALRIPPEPELPIVVDHDNDFLILHHYSPPAIQARLFMLLDSTAAVKYLGSDTGLRSMQIAQRFRDLHAVDYHEFVGQHREFFLARIHPEGWIIQKLIADGADLQLVQLDKEKGHFVEDALIFRVRIPDSMVSGDSMVRSKN